MILAGNTVGRGGELRLPRERSSSPKKAYTLEDHLIREYFGEHQILRTEQSRIPV